jgi:hypothetical protein
LKGLPGATQRDISKLEGLTRGSTGDIYQTLKGLLGAASYSGAGSGLSRGNTEKYHEIRPIGLYRVNIARPSNSGMG